MIVSACKHDLTKKFGKNRNGTQRVRCTLCGKTWTDAPANVLGNMRIDLELAERILKCLCEGVSVRATSRLLNVNVHTIIDLMVLIGGRCQRFLNNTLRGVAVEEVQIDEAWQFVFCKEKTAKFSGYGPECGDSYLFTAIERNTKLMVAWHFGKRDQWNTDVFCERLANATSGKFMLSSDGYLPYLSAVVRYLGHRVEHGVLVKIYGNVSQDEARRYSPPRIKSIKKQQAWNLPDENRICTSHVERSNLNLRTFVRRMARLSNGFSKKWANHEAMVALYICHYNYVRVHGKLKTTPAVASGVEAHKWTVREMIEQTAAH